MPRPNKERPRVQCMNCKRIFRANQFSGVVTEDGYVALYLPCGCEVFVSKVESLDMMGDASFEVIYDEQEYRFRLQMQKEKK